MLVLAEYIQRVEHREATSLDFAQEADVINIICLGYRARDIRLLKKGVFSQCETRDCLTKEQNEYIKEAQELNITLMNVDLDKMVRYQAIYKDFCRKHPNPDLVNDDIETMTRNRRSILGFV